MDQPFVIGIDIGTGSTKAVAMGRDGKVLATSREHYTSEAGEDGLDIHEVWKGFVSCIQQIGSKLHRKPAAIALSSAMHSLLPVDTNGAPLSKALLWSDNRSSATAQELRQNDPQQQLYARTGMALHSMSPLCKLVWLREEEPALWKRAARWISIKEWIWWKLTGTYEVDHSIAAASGLFDPERKCWDEAALELAGLTASSLSQPVEAYQVREAKDQALVEELGLTRSLSFFTGTSDGCAASINSGLTSEVATVTIGTSAAVRVITSERVLHPPSCLFSYPVEENIWVSGGGLNNGGNLLNWIHENLLSVGDDEDFEKSFSALQNVRAEGLLMLPYLHGERAPHWNEKACGVFYRLTAAHGRQEMARAAVEGLFFAIRSVLSIIEEQVSPVSRISFSGGASGIPFLCELLADISGKEIAVHDSGDASARGAALMGAKGLGWISSFKEFTQQPSALYHPDLSTNYEEAFQKHQLLYQALKPLMH